MLRDGSSRTRLRDTAGAGAIAVGLLASIATSGYVSLTGETAPFRVAVADLYEETSELARICQISGYDNDVNRFIYELTISGDRLQSALIPVILSVDGTSARTERALASSEDSHVLKLSVPDEQIPAGSGCSPWARVTLGPLDGEAADGFVTWTLAISAEVSDAASFPSDNEWSELEIRSAR